MADNVQWIKFKVGTFDGISFKRIKKAKIDGVVNFRDKLTAVWFELLDLSGKVNNQGYLFNDEMAFSSYEDIAIAIDRTEDEVKLCIDWFKKNKMIEIIDDILFISNWTKYQNNDGLEKIKEKNRLRQQRYREKQQKSLPEPKNKDNVTVTLRNVNPLIDNISYSNSNSLSYFSNKELNKVFIDYLDMRKKIKSKATDRAIELVIKKLKDLSNGDEDIQIKILEQSIMNSWKGVFPLNKDFIEKTKKNNDPDWVNDFQKELEEKERKLEEDLKQRKKKGNEQ